MTSCENCLALSPGNTLSLFDWHCWRVVLDGMPYGFGRVVFILNRHEPDPNQLTQDELKALLAAKSKVRQVCAPLFGVDSFTLARSPDSAPHIHFVLTPHFNQRISFFKNPEIAYKEVNDELLAALRNKMIVDLTRKRLIDHDNLENIPLSDQIQQSFLTRRQEQVAFCLVAFLVSHIWLYSARL